MFFNYLSDSLLLSQYFQLILASINDNYHYFSARQEGGSREVGKEREDDGEGGGRRENG
jgi:hypothetical protein